MASASFGFPFIFLSPLGSRLRPRHLNGLASHGGRGWEGGSKSSRICPTPPNLGDRSRPSLQPAICGALIPPPALGRGGGQLGQARSGVWLRALPSTRPTTSLVRDHGDERQTLREAQGKL